MKIFIVLVLCLVIYSCGGSDKQNQPQNKVESPKEEVTNTSNKSEKSIDDGNIYYKVDSVEKSTNRTVLYIKTQFPYKEDVIKKIAEEMYAKSTNKQLFVWFYLKNKNNYSKPFATVSYPGGDVYYPSMYPEKIDVAKIQGDIIGAWYDDNNYKINVLGKKANNYVLNVFENTDYVHQIKLKIKNSQATVFEENIGRNDMKGLLFTITKEKKLEVFSQSGKMIVGLYEQANLDSIKVK